MAHQNQVAIQNENEEYRQIKKDFIRVIILNTVLFAVLIGLFIWNQQNSGVDNLMAKILRF